MTEHKQKERLQAKRRTRSPAYPSINLRVAIEQARVLYDHEKRTSAPASVVVTHWGSNVKSSTGLRLLAALKQFGLLEEEGEGEDRMVRLSSLALDILLAPSDDDPARMRAIKKAALLPRVHKELWEHFQGNLLSDPNLRSYLLRTLDFNDAVVDQLIKRFRSTVGFARLSDSDIMDESENEVGDSDFTDEYGERHDSGAATERPLKKGPKRSLVQGASPPGNGPYISFPLPGGNVIEICLRSRVSRRDFERIKTLVDLSEPSLVEEAPSEDRTDG